jgi:CubicO group peptidase (beta-lactamase class C family)
VLGEVMEAASGSSLEDLIAKYVLDPLGLEDTVADQTPAVPEPVVHAFTAERGIWEGSTFWNPSWTLPEVLDDSSYEELIDPELVGFGSPLDRRRRHVHARIVRRLVGHIRQLGGCAGEGARCAARAGQPASGVPRPERHMTTAPIGIASGPSQFD